MRAVGAAICAAVLQSLPISHHFHGCTALLVLRFVVVKWRYIKYLALFFFTFYHAILVSHVIVDSLLFSDGQLTKKIN